MHGLKGQIYSYKACGILFMARSIKTNHKNHRLTGLCNNKDGSWLSAERYLFKYNSKLRIEHFLQLKANTLNS